MLSSSCLSWDDHAWFSAGHDARIGPTLNEDFVRPFTAALFVPSPVHTLGLEALFAAVQDSNQVVPEFLEEEAKIGGGGGFGGGGHFGGRDFRTSGGGGGYGGSSSYSGGNDGRSSGAGAASIHCACLPCCYGMPMRKEYCAYLGLEVLHKPHACHIAAQAMQSRYDLAWQGCSRLHSPPSGGPAIPALGRSGALLCPQAMHAAFPTAAPTARQRAAAARAPSLTGSGKPLLVSPKAARRRCRAETWAARRVQQHKKGCSAGHCMHA